jgi:predicted DNA-binding transcriptional regulator YafY
VRTNTPGILPDQHHPRSTAGSSDCTLQGRVEDDRGGWCVPVVGGEDLDWLAVHVARLGFAAQVLEPPQLRKAAVLLARRLAAMAGTG